ncbi:MAG: sulfite exporter TauE/SafE family protein [Pseudomonadota bacterium]
MSPISIEDPAALATIALALFLGGVLKGAIGMGSPVLAIPVMASFFDVRLAVVIMVVPNLMTNLWQLWTYRAHRLSGAFPYVFAGAGMVGTFLGTVVLVLVSQAFLKLLVAGAVIVYVGLRLARPDFALGDRAARALAIPMGAIAGALQGAAGLSAPVSVSFLNAMRLGREVFIVTISLLFVGMSLVQIPMLTALGLMTAETALLGAAALSPLLAGMPVGGFLAARLSPERFDRIVIVVLVGLALKLVIDVI